MTPSLPKAALACAVLIAACPTPAAAHAIAGVRIFPVTLTIGDPGVANEASLPTVTWHRSGANGGPGAVHQCTVGGEFSKRITERLALVPNSSYVIRDTENDKTRAGWQDLVGTVKFQTYVDGPHELIISLSVVREFGRTGPLKIGADEYGNTTPTVYFGKGLGDLPDFFGRLIPLVEVAYSAPASASSNLGTQLVVAPGVLYESNTFQVGVEALIPANRASGSNVGVIAQFHVFFDDLFPNSLGKPLLDF